KKVFALTEQGRQELQKWMTTPSKLDLDLRNETFIKLTLARRLPHVDPIPILTVERQACLARLHEVMQARACAQLDRPPLQTLFFRDLAVLRLEAFVKWLDLCEETLKKESNR